MDESKRNMALLAARQALLLVDNSVLITVDACAGFAIAINKASAMLPVTARRTRGARAL
jgi:hypothetical protein